jgi:isocitrate dehydrogenase (NAD+)
LLLSAVMMLGWLGLESHAERLSSALQRVFSQGTVRTRDLGGTASTRKFTDAVIAEL